MSKTIELDYAGVPGKVEEKTDMVYEIQNSTLSENAKSFILNSLKSLSEQNLKDCQEVGFDADKVVEEKDEKDSKVKLAMKEHGLTENQAFLYVNGDRNLTEAKKASKKVQSKK